MATARSPVVAELFDQLRRDPALRDELTSLLGEGVATRADIARILERLDEHGRILEQHGRAIEALIEAVRDQGKRIEEQGKRIEEQGRRVEEAFRRVEALGARWGLHSESAFREGMRSVLSRRFGADVRRWEGFDQDGSVFGHPSSVEVDMVVRDGGVLLIEAKSHVSRGDLAAFHRKAELYERQTGARPARLIVSPSVEPRALEMARDMGIEVSTSLEG